MIAGPFNPLDMPNLAESIGNAILNSKPTPLGTVARFQGAGIYAIYYTGDFPAYAQLGRLNGSGRFLQPIYVGKAVPAGGRRGIVLSISTTALFSRINEHRQSIMAAENLSIDDFHVRWLVVEPIWVPLGETLLITRFQPLWNALIDGFGNHDPGAGRRAGVNSRWDTLHHGRTWAALSAARPETPAAIVAEAQEYIRSRAELLGIQDVAVDLDLGPAVGAGVVDDNSEV